jgi:hypothetical protein
MGDNQKTPYEPPSIEPIETDGAPIETSAGLTQQQPPT